MSAALVAAALVLSACTGSSGAAGPGGTPSAKVSAASRQTACRAAVREVLAATQRYVDVYSDVGLTTTPSATSGTASPSPTASPSGTGTAPASNADSALQAAIATATRIRRTQGCDPTAFNTGLTTGLGQVTSHGAVAGAVLRQLRANLTGQVATAPTTVRVAPGDDLDSALATAATGSTLQLAAGTYALTGALVLLRGVTLSGAGAGQTTITSTAADGAVLVLTGDRVVLSGLAMRRTGTAVGSVVIGGSSASLQLTGVAVSGARLGAAGGGAGVLMTAGGGQVADGSTTLEVTDSTFSANQGAGIALTGAHRGSIVSSRFTGNGQCGVCFLGASGGAVRSSVFTGNAAGVAVAATSRPLVVGNHLSGGQVGVQAVDSAAPVLRDNTVTDATRAAVIWSAQSGGRADGTTCRRDRYGLVVASTAHPFLGQNACAVAQSK
jgi:hypothetical protein